MNGGTLNVAHLFLGTPNCGGLGEVTVNAGQTLVTEGGNGILLIENGTFTVNGGTVVLDRLVMNSACGRFIHNGGSLSITSLQLDPSLDADGDGLPNAYEQANGLDPLNPADAGVDNDGDGFSNLQEFLAGTSPTNAASAFRISSVTRAGINVNVAWTAVAGKTNVVQAAGDLTGSYSNISANIVMISSETNYLDTGGATNVPTRVYRIRLVP